MSTEGLRCLERVVDFIVLRGAWDDGSIPAENKDFFGVALSQMAYSIFTYSRARNPIASHHIEAPDHIESLVICMEKMTSEEFYSEFLKIINQEYSGRHPHSFETMKVIEYDEVDAGNKTFCFTVGNSKSNIKIISVGMIHWGIKDQMRGATSGKDVLKITSEFISLKR
jgi:hypothetical protein